MTREGQFNDKKSNDEKQFSTCCQWGAAGFNDKKPTYNDNGAISTTKGTCNDKKAIPAFCQWMLLLTMGQRQKCFDQSDLLYEYFSNKYNAIMMSGMSDMSDDLV